jgi:hypothetical protein
MAIGSVLIYIVSLTLQSVMDVTIDIQCTDIELTSPVYFIKDAACHVQFPQQVNSKSITKVSFRTGIDRDTFGGVLLYHLQGKADTSITTQLLVIWGYNSDGLYLDQWLIEHESTLVWNEDKLKTLCEIYKVRDYVYLNTRLWLLNDDTRLQTMYETLYGNSEMKITIFKEKYHTFPKKPLWIDSNR